MSRPPRLAVVQRRAMSPSPPSSASSVEGFAIMTTMTTDAAHPMSAPLNAEPGPEAPTPRPERSDELKGDPKAGVRPAKPAPGPDRGEPGLEPNRLEPVSEDAPRPPSRLPAPSSLMDNVTLAVNGGEQVVSTKAVLALQSIKLRSMLEADHSCKTLEVKGSAAAWRFVSEYPTMLNKDRIARLKPYDIECARLAAELLPVANDYDMPKLAQECEQLFSRWARFAPSDGLVDVPTSPVWWIHLASKHDRPALAEPVMAAMVADPQRAWLVAEVLPAAMESGVPELMQECEDAACQWHTFSTDASEYSRAVDPTRYGWWIRMAAKYDRPALAEPAIRALAQAPKSLSANGVKLVAGFLPMAMKLNKLALRRDCETVLSRWTTFSPDAVTSGEDGPANPIWWLNLAAKHDNLALAGPALKALAIESSRACQPVSGLEQLMLLRKSACRQVPAGSPDSSFLPWKAALDLVLLHCRRQQGQLWQLICSTLANS